MKVAFRADGGEGIGLGHLTRCMALAEAFKAKDVSSYFICRDDVTSTKLLRDQGYLVHTIPVGASVSDEMKKCLAWIQDADIIIVDTYHYTQDMFEELVKKGKFVVSIDDKMERRQPVHLVIGNAYATREHYGPLLPADAELVSGPQYLPLRRLFQPRPKYKADRQLERILVTMGGEDPHNVTKQVIEELESYPSPLTIDVLLGAAYVHSTNFMNRNSKHTYELHQNIQNLPELFQQVDAAVTAPGMTLWELAASGMPMIVIQTADNQNGVVGYVQKHQLALVLGWYREVTPEKMSKALSSFEDLEVRQGYSHRCQNSVDGLGADRLAEKVLKAYQQWDTMKQIEFVRANPDPESADSLLIWKWRNDEETRRMSRISDPLPWEQHRSWYANAARNPNITLLILLIKNEPTCMVRFDRVDGGMEAEISINVNPNMRHRGLGQLLLQAACRYGFDILKLKRIDAEIKPDNVASIKIFERVGFVFKERKGEMLSYERDCDRSP